MGDPAQLFSPHEHEKIWAIQKELDFPGYVFGVSGKPVATILPDVLPRYAKSLQRHKDDKAV